MRHTDFEGISIAVHICEPTECGQYCDTLYFTPAEYDALSDDDIAAAVRERTKNWVEFVQAQAKAAPVEPTDEEVAARKAELQAELDTLNTIPSKRL